MKKYLVISLVFTLMLTGCGAEKTKTMTCSYETSANNIATKMKYDIDYENNDVKKVRITYDYKYKQNTVVDNDNDGKEDIDGVGTGTDGTTTDTQRDNDGIIDGVVGNAIDKVVGGVTDVILDVAGLRERHRSVQSTYANMKGFSVQNTTDTDNNYMVTYVIDYDTISDTDLATLNLSRDINTFRDTYTSQGYTCK